jgi:carbon monoxide dehydrogenase subunit G
VAKITATEEQVFNVPVSPDRVYAFFADLEKVREITPGVERCERLPDGRVRWVLEEKIDKGIRFQADFVVVYDGNGTDHVRCRFVEGNMVNQWDVWMTPVAGGTEIRYSETVAPELPITPVLALLIKPLVARELRNGVNRFLDRVREVLAN